MNSSPSCVLSLATKSLENERSQMMPEGLKHVDPVQVPTFVLQKMSLYPVLESAAATGSYWPLESFVNGTTETLKPVAGDLFHEPWRVT